MRHPNRCVKDPVFFSISCFIICSTCLYLTIQDDCSRRTATFSFQSVRRGSGEGHSILRALLEPCLLLPLTFHLIECRPEKCCFILGSPVPRLKSQIGGECIVSSTMFQITLILALYCPAETQLTRNNQMVSKTDPSLRHGSTQWAVLDESEHCYSLPLCFGQNFTSPLHLKLSPWVRDFGHFKEGWWEGGIFKEQGTFLPLKYWFFILSWSQISI